MLLSSSLFYSSLWFLGSLHLAPTFFFFISVSSALYFYFFPSCQLLFFSLSWLPPRSLDSSLTISRSLFFCSGSSTLILFLSALPRLSVSSRCRCAGISSIFSLSNFVHHWSITAHLFTRVFCEQWHIWTFTQHSSSVVKKNVKCLVVKPCLFALTCVCSIFYSEGLFRKFPWCDAG